MWGSVTILAAIVAFALYEYVSPRRLTVERAYAAVAVLDVSPSRARDLEYMCMHTCNHIRVCTCTCICACM